MNMYLHFYSAGLLEQLPHNNNIVKYLHHERTRDKIRLFITKYSSTLGHEIRQRKVDIDEVSEPTTHCCGVLLLLSVVKWECVILLALKTLLIPGK
tara:strand:- start:937 stop:1224 length:288 start_codon:yes stop_codon:yes gene_type:complete